VCAFLDAGLPVWAVRSGDVAKAFKRPGYGMAASEWWPPEGSGPALSKWGPFTAEPFALLIEDMRQPDDDNAHWVAYCDGLVCDTASEGHWVGVDGHEHARLNMVSAWRVCA
jgi:hypothetical protein